METRYELIAYNKDNYVLWTIGFHNSDDAINFARNRVKDRRESFHTLVLLDENTKFMSWTRRPYWTVERLEDTQSTRLI